MPLTYDHVKATCRKGCKGCPLCQDALFVCKTCGLIQGQLTSECCGRLVTEEEERSITNRDLDFKHGRWVERS